MDKKTVFVKTNKGESEVNGQSDALYGDAKRILLLVDDESTVGDISKRAPPSLRETLFDMLQQLVDGGYIRDMRAAANVPQKPTLKMASPAIKMPTPKVATPPRGAPNAATPPKPMPTMAMPAMPPLDIKNVERAQADTEGDLDFSFIMSGTSQSESDAEAVKEKAQAGSIAKARQEAEADRLKAVQSTQYEAAAGAAKTKAYEEAKEKAKIVVASKARIDAEARVINEAEAARLKAEQDALKVRTELEATRARVEAEVRARIEAEARAKQEAEAVRLKAEREAEKIRLELVAAEAKAELEMRNRVEAEAHAKAEVEARLKREEEAARLRIEKERAELEVARVKAEAELRMRAEAEMRVRAEVEERIKREAEAERLKIEKERADLEVARVKAEAELRMRAESEARVRAEVEARLKAEALAQISPHQDALSGAGVSHIPAKEEQIDPAEKLRQSFVKSFGQDKGKQESSPLGFKLDTFSLADQAQKAKATAQPKKPGVPAGGGSKVKAAIEQRAQKEAEAQRIKTEQEAARLRAEQEQAASIRAAQEQAVSIKAEQESIRLKAGHEASSLKAEQERKRETAEAEARKLSEQQAKQWEEAQRRAVSQAQAEKERLAKQPAEAPAKYQQKLTRVPRKPLPIGKMVASLFVLVLVVVAGLPYIWPLDAYIAPLEKEISAQLSQPIHIKKINFALLPLPKLELHTLTVGSGQEIKVGDVVLNFDFSALFAPTKSINKMELKNVTLTGASLDKVVLWLQAAGGIEKYPVARMELLGVRVMSDEIKLPLLNGRADFDAQGKFTKADLKSEDGKFGLELQSLQKRFLLELNIHESSLPVLPDLKFNDLSVNGVLGNGEVIFSDFFAHLYGGTLTGKGQLNWSNGWKLQGQINAKSLELQSMFPHFGLTGELYGDVNVSMYGPALSQLDKDPHMEGTFAAKNGIINKLDIETISRFGSRQGTPGRTNFSELIGTLKADQRSQRFNLNKIAAGVVSGSGFFEVDAKQQLSGKLLVDIKGPANGSVPLQLSGSPAEPLLQPGR